MQFLTHFRLENFAKMKAETKLAQSEQHTNKENILIYTHTHIPAHARQLAARLCARKKFKVHKRFSPAL